MKRVTLVTIAALISIAISIGGFGARSTIVKASSSSAEFDSNGRLMRPAGYRRWVFLGAPLTPDGLNGGKASFPEYHHVYVEERNLEAYLKTGSFPEGTVIVKELTRVLDPKFPDGSRTEPSGRGYFDGEFNGLDVTVKDSKRFAKTSDWGFFNFGHHPEPYAESAEEASATECASCHMTLVAKTDMTWVQFYPMLRSKLSRSLPIATARGVTPEQARAPLFTAVSGEAEFIDECCRRSA